MKVKLVSVTGSVLPDMAPEDLIVYCARVSNPNNRINKNGEKLIQFLIDNEHWSPFEMVDMCVEIKTSRAIAQQILRHRSFSFQEFSQRYSLATEIEDIELRHQAVINRQSSTEVMEDKQLVDMIDDAVNNSLRVYDELIALGVAKESARFVLPLAVQTTIYMKGSVRSWIHYLNVRCDEHTQKEHQLIAREIREIFKEEFPTISKAIHI